MKYNFIKNIEEIILSVFLSLFIAFVMFVTIDVFQDSEILTKWYIFLIGGFVLGILMLCVRGGFLFNDKTALCIFILVIYMLIWNIISYSGVISFCTPIVFFVLFLSFRNLSIQTNIMIKTVIILVCLFQAIYGILQYIEVLNVNNRFIVVGSYDNPSGVAACLSAGFPYCFSLFHKKKLIFLITGIISSIVIFIAIILSGSRSGILSAIIVLFFYFVYKFVYARRGRWRQVILYGGILSILFMGILLFVLKKNSAIGRLLIWNNTIALIRDRPILGYGPSGFTANYMNSQASYFMKNPGNAYSQLADNVMFPFNEYLLMLVEYGSIGLLILLVVILVIAKESKKMCDAHLCLLSIGIFACFSYPLRYPYVLLLLSYSIAISLGKVSAVRINLMVKRVLIVMLIIGIYVLCQDICFEKKWHKLVELSTLGNTKRLISEYEELYRTWNYNPLFLYNYAAILNKASKFNSSTKIAKECEKYFNDYDIQILLANNYYNQNEFIMAEKCYITASHMCPNRFIPLYGLFILYKKNNNIKKCIELSNLILNKPIKLKSRTIDYIQRDVSVFISTQKCK